MEKPKEYNLTKEEKQLLEGQDSIRAQHQYITELVRRDIFMYINGNIRKRLGIAEDVQLQWDREGGKIFTIPKPEEPKTGEKLEDPKDGKKE